MSTQQSAESAEKSLRLVIYSRISLVERDPVTGERDEAKVIAQEGRCREWAERNGHTVAAVIRENSTSAFREWTRPKFNATLTQMKEGEVDGVVSYVHDRLVRHPKEMEALIDLAEDDGRLVYTLDNIFDLTTDSGRLAARVLVAFARAEVERKGKRHRDGNERRRLDGKPPQGGGRPFGFEPDKVTILRREAALIRWATKRYLRGTSLRALVQEWNTAGVLTSRGGQWNRNTMTGLLRRWRNAGLVEHDGEVLGAAAWPAIVSRELLEEVHRKMATESAKAQGRPTSSARKHLLSGIVRCSTCGSPMKGDTATSKSRNGTQRQYLVYRCNGGSAVVRCWQSVRMSVVDEMVLGRVARMLANPPSGLVSSTAIQRARALRARHAGITDLEAEVAAADLSAGARSMIARLQAFEAEKTAITTELDRLAENDALAALVADLSPWRRSDGFDAPAGNVERVEARLAEMRTADLARLRMIIRSVVEVEIAATSAATRGSGTRATARARVTITRAHRECLNEDWRPSTPEVA